MQTNHPTQGGGDADNPELSTLASAPEQEVSAEFKRPDDTEGGTCD